MNFFKPNFWDKNHISFFSTLLFPITLLVKVLFFFRRHLGKNKKFPIPIICVGNIYLGGTGKTPICIEIFKILKELNMMPAFIRKKYISQQDEVDLQKQTGPMYEHDKRAEAIKNAIHDQANIAILDDGFQDFSIKKNLSFICFNEKQWVGNGLTIPSGPLRESLTALKRANCVIINGKKNIFIEKKIFSKNKNIKIFYTQYKVQNADNFKNKKVIAFAGIGNPENFFNLLKDSMVNIVEKFKFPDHYNYSNDELENLIDKKKKNNCLLITTEKDFLRIKENYRKDINFLKIKTEIENKDNFINEIKKII
jgi:tetraacyldisaccharide 4'-kinase